MPLLEICVDTADGLHAALDGGADRIELCAALSVGGLTPPPSLLALAARAPVPVHAMIRPRDGDFAYSEGEIEQMHADIDAVRRAGLAGIVVGASTSGGALDRSVLADLMAAKGDLHATLHRAFDLTSDPFVALEQAIALGFRSILTSGLAPTADEGAALIAELVTRAAGRIEIMAGSGIRPETVPDLIRRTGVSAIHASASEPQQSYGPDVVAFGFAHGPARRATSAATVRALKAACA